jgi:cell division protein FtsL
MSVHGDKRVRGAELVAAVLLAAGVVTSGIIVTATKHESRQLFAELEELKREEDRLQIDWGRLQLEESTRGMHARIETFAREKLELYEPDPKQILIVVRPTQ